QKKVQEMSTAGIHPREILSTLRQSNPNNFAISKTIYNARDKIRHDNLQGRTPIQALLDELVEENIEHYYQYNQNGNLTHLFFAHPKSIILTKTYNSILLMDCTYKTNKFKMPLLHVVGMTSFNTTFSSCFAFLKSEQEEDYKWALTCVFRIFGDIPKPQVIVTDRELALMNAVKTVFTESQNLLCIWHIGKNVLVNCRRYFQTEVEWSAFMESWSTLIKSKTETDFGNNWEKLVEKYNEKQITIEYLKETWLPFKANFVSCWADRYLHLGNMTTSRVEGAHAMLKMYLQVSMGNLLVVHEKITLALENQYQEIKTKASQEMIRIPHALNKPFYAQVVSKVSEFALKKAHEQFLKASNATPENPLRPCSGTFKSSMGLPCSHVIQEFLDNNKCLQLDDFHQHWWIQQRQLSQQESSETEVSLRYKWEEYSQKFDSLPLYQKSTILGIMSSIFQESTVIVQDPQVQPTRERPVGAKNRPQPSTKRDPSTFELIISKNYNRKCGVCRGVGHNSRTCPNLENLDEGHNRKCGICREIGHNSRTCPNIEDSYEESNEDSNEDN
ncbi:2637_t:CDS:2, partial [Scutellospora calospora]